MERVLVCANETLGAQKLIEEILPRAEKGDTEFFLVVPESRPRQGSVIYLEAVRDAAQVRIDLAKSFMAEHGVHLDGEVGDSDPYAAILDAVREFRPTSIIISTYPEVRSGWLRRDLIERVEHDTGLPVTHVVADPDSEGLPFKVALVVANQTVRGCELHDRLKALAAEEQYLFIVVVPQEGGEGLRAGGAQSPSTESRRRRPRAWSTSSSTWPPTTPRRPRPPPDAGRVGPRHRARPRRASRPAAGQPVLAGRPGDARDAALHHLRGDDLRRVLHGVLLHPGGRRERAVAGAGLRAACRHRRRQHGHPAVVVAHPALGPDGRQARQPPGDEGRNGRDVPARSDLPVRPDQRVRPPRHRAVGHRPGLDVLRAHRPARRARVHRAGAAVLHHRADLPRALLARGAQGDGDPRDLLALRGRDVDRRLHDDLRPLVLNPLRSEAEAFRFLVWVFVVAAVVVGIVVLIRAVL